MPGCAYGLDSIAANSAFTEESACCLSSIYEAIGFESLDVRCVYISSGSIPVP